MKYLQRFLQSLVLLAFSLGIARADLVTFDDLSFGVPNGYHGIDTWSNFYVDDTSSFGPGANGYINGTVTPNNVAYNSSALDAYLVNSTAFDLNSGYFTAAWNEGLHLQVIGFNGATELYNNTYTLSTLSPLLINLNYLGVTEVQFHSYGGIPQNYQGSGEHFAMDNVTINGSSVPDAGATMAYIGIAFTGFLAIRRRLR